MDYRINPEAGQYWVAINYNFFSEYKRPEIVEILSTKAVYYKKVTSKTMKTLSSLGVQPKETVVYHRSMENYVSLEWDKLSEFVKFFYYLGEKRDAERYLEEKNIKWIIE